MTAKEAVKAYESATKYKSFRSARAMYKVQDRFGGEWRTLFCLERKIEALGYLALIRGKQSNRVVRVIDRAGEVVAL